MGTAIRRPPASDVPSPAEPEPSEGTVARRRTWPAVLLSTAIVAGLFTLLFLRNHRFAWLDDRQADSLAKLIDIGRILQSGEWPWLSTNLVNSGAHAIEAQYGVFNPFDLAFGVLIGNLDDLALGSFLQLLTHVLILTAAAAWLGRLIGLTTGWTVAFAVSVGFGTYTIYWGAAWYEAVTSFSWFVLALAAVVAMHLTGRTRYGWVLLVATYLCYQSGWPLAVPLLGLTVLVLVAARFLTGNPRATSWWILAWYGGGALTSLVGLYPLFVSFRFAARQSSISNESNANVASLEGLLHAADPSYHGWLNLFSGVNELQPLPHYYVAWFLLPVVCFWRIDAARCTPRVRALLGASVVLAAVTALAALGPERLLVFRFPTRFLQYGGLFLLLTAALLVAHGARTVTRRRLLVFGAAIALLAVNAWQADPAGLHRIVGLTVVVTALGVALVGPREVRAVLRSAEPGTGTTVRTVGWVAAAGTVLVMAATAYGNPYARGADRGLPSSQSDFQTLSREDYTLWYGTHPQFLYGGETGEGVEEVPQEFLDGFYAEYHPSSTGLIAGDRSVNGYSPLAHRFLLEHVPFDDQGNMPPDAAQSFLAEDPETGLTWLELLRVDQVVAPLGPRDDALRPLLDDGWERVPGEYTAAYQRDPYELPGLLSSVSPEVTVAAESRCPQRNSRECVEVTVDDAPGRVVFARLWFPGYRATLDGQPIDVTRLDGTLVAVDLPAGASGELVLSYRSPGFVPLAALAVATVVGLAAAQTVAVRRRRAATPVEDSSEV
ncbi:hypothetical protein [Blastococcus sp. TF02A-26]|uniref:hypothetical protein n=1 Tax=Blastococcus sp. TF02A-26 TaxID=2250577 RepID=UPI000DE8393A|nr:hypothetical protein [Blastococcus sp. TF02A-26]RBY89807.1 hypothetical protein DQ240_02510 [Blastococcus sp. TF02A-26]